MSKFTAFIIILTLRILIQPSESKKDFAPFAKPSHFREFTIQLNNSGETTATDFINKDNEIIYAELSKTKNY